MREPIRKTTQMEKPEYDLVRFSQNHSAPLHQSVKWFKPDIDKKVLKQLMRRRDLPALRDTVCLYVLMGISLAIALWFSPTLPSIPFWLIYGVLYASAADSRWHEMGHQTAFKTPWLNHFVYHLACFMIMRNPVTWKHSHARHHTETLMIGRDPEIALMRPPAALKIALNFFGIPDIIDAFKRMSVHAMGKICRDEALYIPETQWKKAILISRIWLAIYAVVVLFSILSASVIPLLIVGGPRLYGSWHFNLTGLIQHGGMKDDVNDHRLNTRTVKMNLFSRFIYLNMNYHLEHHLFPAVPYYNLPALHEELKDQLPPALPSIWTAYRQMLPILWRQLRGEECFYTPQVKS